jgi:hypothetical protein
MSTPGTPEYLKKMPAEIPPGRVLVHNQVYPVARTPGTRGSRCWLADPSPELEPCPCGWAPGLGTHYRVIRARQPRHPIRPEAIGRVQAEAIGRVRREATGRPEEAPPS